MFADELKKVRERYKEYDGCYLGHYAQWFFWFFFTIGFFVKTCPMYEIAHRQSFGECANTIKGVCKCQ